MRGVLFDAGNTLIRVRGSVGKLYASVASRHGIDVDGRELDARFRQYYWERRSTFVGTVSNPHSPEKERAWWRGLVRDVFDSLAVPPTGPRFEAYFEDLYGEFARAENWEIFEDVVPCLDALDDLGVPAGVVSNWDSRLHVTLEGLGIRERFRFVITSAEFGAEKPHPSIFLEAVQRLRLDPGEVLFVGDLLVEDVHGSRGAGLRPVLIDRSANAGDEVPRVRDLREVAQMVRQARLSSKG